jgi:undecaprenyl-diphosphatase
MLKSMYKGMRVILVLQNIDNSILLFIKNNMHSYIMDKAMVTFTSLGDGGVVWIVIAILLMINKKYRKIGFIVLGALTISAVLGEGILKHLIQRIRPCADIPSINMLIAKPLSYSFPSGHSASSFAGAAVLANYFKKYKFIFFGLAFLIAFSRLYLYVHYPTDVLAGIILGLICSKVSIILSQYITERIDKNEYGTF